MAAERTTRLTETERSINAELQRIVGGEGVTCEVESEADEHVARVETARSVYEFPADRLLQTLRDVQDDVGVMALRSRLDRLRTELDHEA